MIQMTLEERKDNTYFDQTGKQILEGDLLRVFHFKTKRKIHYMYHVVVMEDGSFPVMALRSYYADKPHYRLYSVCDNRRIVVSSKIVAMKDWQTKRQKIKPTTP